MGRIYELSWDMFGDLPRGHHKNNSMHKLASKTMIEILPENLANHVEKKCGSLAGTPDFFDVIGQVAFDISYFIIIAIKLIFLSTDRSFAFAFEPRTSPQVNWYEPEA